MFQALRRLFQYSAPPITAAPVMMTDILTIGLNLIHAIAIVMIERATVSTKAMIPVPNSTIHAMNGITLASVANGRNIIDHPNNIAKNVSILNHHLVSSFMLCACANISSADEVPCVTIDISVPLDAVCVMRDC